jgi:hypothetical protein
MAGFSVISRGITEYQKYRQKTEWYSGQHPTAPQAEFLLADFTGEKIDPHDFQRSKTQKHQFPVKQNLAQVWNIPLHFTGYRQCRIFRLKTDL